MSLALVHDDLIQHGGAERLFTAMTEIWPRAPIFTSMASGLWLKELGETAGRLQDGSFLRTSFMQYLPFKEHLYRAYFPLYSFAFESFDFSNFDVVLSSSTRFAHGVITKPGTTHICYMNSPGRMWWEPGEYFGRFPGSVALLTSPFLSWLRAWDYAAAQRVDYFIANSRSVQKKIKKYYGRDSEIIYPFVELERFVMQSGSVGKTRPFRKDGSFLIVSRLASWKRIDIAVEACSRLKLPLVIVGEGPDRKRLERKAGPTIKFRGRLSDEDVVRCYHRSRALIFPQREDFGITPLEAMASGKPVLAYGAGGALETVLPGETGEFFYPQTAEALAKALSSFRPERYVSEVCRRQAERFSKEEFVRRLEQFVRQNSKCKPQSAKPPARLEATASAANRARPGTVWYSARQRKTKN